MNGETGIPRGLLGNHTYWCALPVRGGVCNCQSDHDPSTDPWPYLSTLRTQPKRGGSAPRQLRGVDRRLDASLGRMPTERGMGLVGMMALVDQDPDSPVDR